MNLSITICDLIVFCLAVVCGTGGGIQFAISIREALVLLWFWFMVSEQTGLDR